MFDGVPFGEGWESFALRVPRHLQFGTGSPSDAQLSVCGAATRAWYDKWSYILHPDYESMYSDNEVTERDKANGDLIQRLDIKFEHRHPVFGTAPMDEVYRDQNAVAKYQRGKKIFDLRKARGFPKESVLAELEAKEKQQETNARPVVAVCTPGEWFHSVWVRSWLELVTNLSQRYSVAIQTGWSSVVHTTRAGMIEAVLQHCDPPADYLFWLDDDNLISPAQFQTLMDDLDRHPEIDMIVGWCWSQFDVFQDMRPPRVSCGILTPDLEAVPFDPQEMSRKELIEVEYSGFPVVLMRGKVAREVGPAGFAPILMEGLRFGFTGEDVSFCVNARKKGFRIFVDPRVQVPHLKLNPVVPPAVRAAHEAELSEGQPAQKGE
jgi:hypothetical protein